jgi:hypothetical protein
MNDVKRGRKRSRSFKPKYIPQRFVDWVENAIDEHGFIKDVVDATIETIMELYEC